ncbi:MAG: L,D-transpeptidase/peptidoglycan binding protein [Atopobiaceae bacterium]|nr:L,D-transpeptidase/peptidoglycan binding protein [Atopobiaceae bacterium]
MSDFDDTMNVAGDDQLNSKPEDLEKTRVADPQTLGAEGDAPVDDAAVTVDATDVDPALVDEILAEITGATAAGEPLDAGDEGAEEPAADAEDQSVEPQTPPIDVLTGSDMMAEASPAAAPVVEAAQASLLGSDAGEAPKGKFRKRALIAAVVVLALLAAAYFAGSMAFGRVFLPGTTINGEDVSLKSVEEVAKANSDSIDSFELNVSGDGVSLQVKAKDIDASFDGNAYASKAMAQQDAWSWPLGLVGNKKINVESSKLAYDEAKLDAIVGAQIDAANAKATDPVSATYSFNGSTIRYEIVPEQYGTKIDREVALGKVRTAIANRQKNVELGEAELVKPQVLSTDEKLNSAVSQANSMLGCVLDFDYNGKTLHTLNAIDLQNWVKIEDDLSVSFDDDACRAWCRGPLSVGLDSVGTARSFTTPDGRDISVSGGTYGWSIDGGELTFKIAEHVRAGQSGHIDLPWLKTANSWNPGGNEWGDTFIDIDLGAQHVRYFQDGNIVWESDCVSGGMNSGKMHYTPTGVYYINDNMESGNVELKGEIDPVTKEPEYISYVHYWMPFIDNSHALHDADWRGSFGGDIYTYSGSHGCVNLPPDKAAELYGMVGVGTVVVVHD